MPDTPYIRAELKHAEDMLATWKEHERVRLRMPYDDPEDGGPSKEEIEKELYLWEEAVAHLKAELERPVPAGPTEVIILPQPLPKKG